MGRSWLVELDYVKLRTIRTEHGVDLGSVESFTLTWGKLLYSDELALAVLWVAIAGQNKGLPQDGWLAAMDGPRLETARDALLAAVFFFTPPAKRTMARKATDALMRAYRQQISEAESQIEEAANEAVQRAQQALGTPPPT